MKVVALLCGCAQDPSSGLHRVEVIEYAAHTHDKDIHCKLLSAEAVPPRTRTQAQAQLQLQASLTDYVV